MTTLSHLECSVCARKYPSGRIQGLCECGGPLLARYDLERARQTWTRESLASAPPTMWRYAPLLPVSRPAEAISLGEGMTPLIRARRLGERLGANRIWIKNEAINPTGTFKARSLSCAISMCVELDIQKVAIPSAGNAAAALATYAAAAGLPAYVFMPADAPQSNFIECQMAGAQVTLVNGLIGECGRMVSERAEAEGWFDMGSMKEPYRLEGNKTMGFELAEQFGWELPGAIVYPVGGGVGFTGIWKAFEELEALGWVGAQRPQMFAVQSEGCQPVVRAWQNGEAHCELWRDARTIASGLRVPKPLGDFLMLDIIRKSGGMAVAVSDREMLDAAAELASLEGIFPSPEGGACVAAAQKMLASGAIAPNARIVLFNTGSGMKYPEAYSVLYPRTAASEQDKLGGLITPR